MSGALRSIFVFYILLLLLVFQGKAAVAGFDADNVEMFVPTSAWLVGPAGLTSVGSGDFHMPCVMMNQYNNGFVLRFSAVDQKVLAMALDFRDDVFSAGKAYDVELEVPPGFRERLNASAHNTETLLINIQPHSSGFYDALSNGKYIYMTMAGVTLNFALPGIREGLERVSECYGRGPSYSRPKAEQEASVKGYGQTVSPSYSNALAQATPDGVKGRAAGGDGEEGILTPMPDGSYPAQERDEIMQELAALDGMLKDAAAKLAGIEPAAGNSRDQGAPQVLAPVHAGGVEQTFSAPPPEVTQAASKRPEPLGKPLAGMWSSPLPNDRTGLKQRDVMVSNYDGAVSANLEKRWRATRGNNLQEVLDVWTKSANVRLIWKTEKDFAIPESMSMQGKFEDAVLTLLEQYDSGKRPVGRIYIDPVLSQRVLLIENAKGR